MEILNNKISKEKLKPGDHIYSWRYGIVYTHHGIYVGENRVIHFTVRGSQDESGTVFGRFFSSSSPPSSSGQRCPECGIHSTHANGVIKSCLECFLDGGGLYLFLYSVTQTFFLRQPRSGTCTLAHSDPPEKVLHRATYLLENGFGEYDLFKNNCEDFSLYCKTELIISSGDGRSVQVSRYRWLLMTLLVPVLCTGSGDSRLRVDIGFRKDVIKVPVERLVAGLR